MVGKSWETVKPKKLSYNREGIEGEEDLLLQFLCWCFFFKDGV
jgi:hypothetical protein